MLAGLDAERVGDLVLFNSAKEPVLVGDRVAYGHTRHLCESLRTPARMAPLREKEKPTVRCRACKKRVSPAEAVMQTADRDLPRWVCHRCHPPQVVARVDIPT